jgi:hypothetical protein
VATFQVHRTILLTNQLGYVQYNENEGFGNSRVLEFWGCQKGLNQISIFFLGGTLYRLDKERD